MKNIDAAKIMIQLNDVRCMLINDEIYCKSYHNYLEGIVENIELIIKNNKKIKIISLESEEYLICYISHIVQNGKDKNATVYVELLDKYENSIYMYSPLILLK